MLVLYSIEVVSVTFAILASVKLDKIILLPDIVTRGPVPEVAMLGIPTTFNVPPAFHIIFPKKRTGIVLPALLLDE